MRRPFRASSRLPGGTRRSSSRRAWCSGTVRSTLAGSINGDGRIRFEFTTTVNYELIHSLYLGFNVYDQYDSNPPQETAQQKDFGSSTTVGYKW